MKHKGLESRNDDILTKEDVASLLEIAESLKGKYTAWGRTFWDGKPQDVTGSPISPNNGGLYIKDSGGEDRLALYYSPNNILYVGRGTCQRGSKTRICGDSIQLVPGTNSDDTSVLTIARDSVSLAAGKAFRVRNWADDKSYDALAMNVNNDFLIGQGVGADKDGLNTYIYGNTITLCHGGTKEGAALVINADMTVSIPKSLKIGTLVLSEGTGSNAGKLLINGSVIY